MGREKPVTGMRGRRKGRGRSGRKGSGLAAVGALLLQGFALRAAGEIEWQHTRYVRPVELRAGAEGQTCVVLDAAVLEHAASRGGNDLRLYAGEGPGAAETPFALTESSATAGDVETVSASHEATRGDVVDFDLQMPDRPYSAIDLGVEGKNFVAIAEATGLDQQGSGGHLLGTVTLFDFSGQGLPRSTQLPLGESSYPWVHVKLRFLDVQGRPLRGRAPVVTGASVPPSRQGQVLYTPVAETRLTGSVGAGSGVSGSGASGSGLSGGRWRASACGAGSGRAEPGV